MIKFENISLKQVITFIKIIGFSNSHQKENIKRRFGMEFSRYEDIFSLLTTLELIEVKNGQIFLSQSLRKKELDDFFIREQVSEALLKSDELESLDNFLFRFKLKDDNYIYLPKLADRLRYSGIRNFLIELGVLQFNPISGAYNIPKKLYPTIVKHFKVLSQKQLLINLKKQEEIGYNAEIAVLRLERNKFKSNKNLQDKIKHISQEDSSAGYDILSFSILKNGILKPKYIEVKAVSLINLKFYWSRNEIEVSRKLTEEYYLYLLPVREDGSLNVDLIEIINNPYVNILSNELWQKINEVLSISSLRS